MGGIFISYRRGDTSPYAGRLSDTLVNRFGPDSIFRDIDGIAPGERFPQVIEQAVGSCDALLALIGRRWLTVKDENRKRRLDDSQDYVRQEIRAALRRDDVLVIPVLIEGATMPDAEDLPDDLAPLAERNAVRISDAAWKDEVVHLIRALERVVKDPAAEAPAPPVPQPQPTPPPPPQPQPQPRPIQPAAGPTTGPWVHRPTAPESGPRRSPALPIAAGLAVLIIAVLGFFLVRAFANFFDEVPKPDFGDTSISLSRSSGPPGTRLTVGGSGFDAGETVRIRLHTTEVAKVQAGADGSITDVPVVIPDLGFKQQFHIVASGDRSIRFAREPFTIT